MFKKLIYPAVGFIVGIINGMLGSGGGTVVVPFLGKMKFEPKIAHATSIAVILPITAVSCFFYFKTGNIDLKSTAVLAASGMAGGFIGAKLLRKVPKKPLMYAFGVMMIYMAVKMLWKGI